MKVPGHPKMGQRDRVSGSARETRKKEAGRELSYSNIWASESVELVKLCKIMAFEIKETQHELTPEEKQG